MICESFAYEHEATRLFEFEISFQTYFAKVCEPRPSLFSIYDIKFALNVRIQNHDRNRNLNNILRLSQCLLKLILQAPSKRISGQPNSSDENWTSQFKSFAQLYQRTRFCSSWMWSFCSIHKLYISAAKAKLPAKQTRLITGNKPCAECECRYKHKIVDEYQIRVLFKPNLFLLWA